jgi:hypothetical protein
MSRTQTFAFVAIVWLIIFGADDMGVAIVKNSTVQAGYRCVAWLIGFSRAFGPRTFWGLAGYPEIGNK